MTTKIYMDEDCKIHKINPRIQNVTYYVAVGVHFLLWFCLWFFAIATTITYSLTFGSLILGIGSAYLLMAALLCKLKVTRSPVLLIFASGVAHFNLMMYCLLILWLPQVAIALLLIVILDLLAINAAITFEKIETKEWQEFTINCGV